MFLIWIYSCLVVPKRNVAQSMIQAFEFMRGHFLLLHGKVRKKPDSTYCSKIKVCFILKKLAME